MDLGFKSYRHPFFVSFRTRVSEFYFLFWILFHDRHPDFKPLSVPFIAPGFESHLVPLWFRTQSETRPAAAGPSRERATTHIGCERYSDGILNLSKILSKIQMIILCAHFMTHRHLIRTSSATKCNPSGGGCVENR